MSPYNQSELSLDFYTFGLVSIQTRYSSILVYLFVLKILINNLNWFF